MEHDSSHQMGTQNDPEDRTAQQSSLRLSFCADPVARYLRKVLCDGLWIRVGVALLVFFGLDKWLLPVVVGTWSPVPPIQEMVPDVEALVIGLITFPALTCYFLALDEGTKALFVDLERKGTFKRKRLLAFYIASAEHSYVSARWTWMSLLCVLIFTPLSSEFLWKQDLPWWGSSLPISERWEPTWLFNLVVGIQQILAFMCLTFILYAVSQILFREIWTMCCLSRLWKRLGKQLEIQPFHPDDAGGLGGVGRHVLVFSSCILMFGILLLMGTFLPYFRGDETKIIDPGMLLGWALYVFLIAVGFRFFMWRPHKLMLAARNRVLLDTSSKINELLAETSKGRLSKDDLERFESLHKFRATHLREYPVWPIGRPFSRYLHVSTLSPLAVMVCEKLYAAMQDIPSTGQ